MGSISDQVTANINAMLLQEHPHFIRKPEGFTETADVLLVLDSGEEFPAHSAFLSAYSETLCNMLRTITPTEKETAVLRLPFPDCTKEAAKAFLLYVYADNGSQILSSRSAELVSTLAHRSG